MKRIREATKVCSQTYISPSFNVEVIKQNLLKYFHFDSFREGQLAVISSIMAGKSAAAIFPTGRLVCITLKILLYPLLPHYVIYVSIFV
jgi:ATP-dependent DNA helicase RecQ